MILISLEAENYQINLHRQVHVYAFVFFLVNTLCLIWYNFNLTFSNFTVKMQHDLRLNNIKYKYKYTSISYECC